MHREVVWDEAIHTWELCPHMIQWHQHHRKFVNKSVTGNPRTHINALLITSSATMVEGAISGLLLFYLEGPFSPFLSTVQVNDRVSSFHDRNRSELYERVCKATWKDYKVLFRTVTGESLPEIFGREWERLGYLFEFRNLLAHGETMRIRESWNLEDEPLLGDVQRNKDKLFSYMENCGFISKPVFGDAISWSFLSDEVADHFVETARTAVKRLAEAAPDSEQNSTFPKRMLEVLENTETPGPLDNTLLYSVEAGP